MTREYIKALKHGYKLGSPDTSAPPASGSSPPVSVSSPPGSRNATFQPFQAESIWNLALGSAAIYRDARMNGAPGNGNVNGFCPNFDPEKIFLDSHASRMPILSSNVGWSGGNRCVGSDVTRTAVPCPSSFILGNSGSNNCGVFLLSDSRTLAQMQPFTHCTNGAGVANTFATSFAFFANQDLFGMGIGGCHGGSGLSGIGGSLRLGELRPGDTEGPHHALKVNLYCRQFLFKGPGNLYRWPADRHDGYAHAARASGGYGTDPTGTGVDGSNSITDMKQGSLLALHPTFDITANLSTTPARLLAWTFREYGAYVCDDVFAPGFALVGEAGFDGDFSTQFQSDWGYPLRQHEQSATAWRRDISLICDNFYVITNSDSPGSLTGGVGGGGATRRQPNAASIMPT